MINRKKVLCVIPARGGSKGLKRKNVKILNGKPLIAWTIEAAKASIYLDKIIVSTEDDEIMDIAGVWGAEVPFKRPVELAQDDTPGIEPVLHAIHKFKDFEYVVLLQPTSPLRTAEDIDTAIELCMENDTDSCVSVVENPLPQQWIYKIDNGSLTAFFDTENFPYQRQKAETTYALNGSVYVAESKSLQSTKSFLNKKTVPYVMPKNRSIDIDDLDDFLLCEYMMSRSLNR